MRFREITAPEAQKCGYLKMMKHCHRRIKPLLLSNFYISVFYLTIILFALSIGMRMYLTNKLAIKGKELEQLSLNKELLEKEISKISFEISSTSSISYIETEAREKGFVDYKQQIAVISPAPVAALIRVQ